MRIVCPFPINLRPAMDGLESAWVVVGTVQGDFFCISDIVESGRDRLGRSVHIDGLREAIGTVHTHTADMPLPSEHDLRMDQVLANIYGVYLTGILSDQLRWFFLRAEDTHYTQVEHG